MKISNKLKSQLSLDFSYFSNWKKLISIMLKLIFDILKDPEFIMFSVIGLLLGTMGIWITFFISDSNKFDFSNSIFSQMDKMSVFTFCIATLGGIATNYVFQEEYKEDRVMNNRIATSAMYFLWMLSMLLSFYALVSVDGIKYALISTLTFWVVINKTTPRFNHPNIRVISNFNPLENNIDTDENRGVGL